jgi:hypothetical protein
MPDKLKSVLQTRGEISPGVFGALFALVRGVTDGVDLIDLESGMQSEVNVWSPVATL